MLRALKGCASVAFNVPKFTSNKGVIEKIPEIDRVEDVKNLEFDCDTLPMEHALGVQWCIKSNTFMFVILLRDEPCTRHGILSTVSSIFDPFRFDTPMLLEGKVILQELRTTTFVKPHLNYDLNFVMKSTRKQPRPHFLFRFFFRNY